MSNDEVGEQPNIRHALQDEHIQAATLEQDGPARHHMMHTGTQASSGIQRGGFLLVSNARMMMAGNAGCHKGHSHAVTRSVDPCDPSGLTATVCQQRPSKAVTWEHPTQAYSPRLLSCSRPATAVSTRGQLHRLCLTQRASQLHKHVGTGASTLHVSCLNLQMVAAAPGAAAAAGSVRRLQRAPLRMACTESPTAALLRVQPAAKPTQQMLNKHALTGNADGCSVCGSASGPRHGPCLLTRQRRASWSWCQRQGV